MDIRRKTLMDTFDFQFLNKACQKLPAPGANGPEKTGV